MADGKNPSNTTAQGNDLVDAAGTLGTSLARVGALMVSWPFYILPAKERDNAIAATTQLFTAVGELHLSFLQAAARGLGLAARELARPAAEDASAPHASPVRVPIETSATPTR